mgnify:CR=1 FL=1|tara:strand:- start:2422 stop:2997 length:576 start_codon:yes stop_codon:yes gene_type:complete
MNDSKKDLLKIQRDAVLKKKRIIDAVEELKQGAPDNQKHFEIHCGYLCDKTNVHVWDPFQNLLNSVQQLGAIIFDIQETGGAMGWGRDIVKIEVTKEFNKVAKQIREKYHALNNQFNNNKKPVDVQDKTSKLMHYTNPFWLLWRISRWIISWVMRHKLISVCIILIGLLATDYALAWKNLKKVLNFFGINL